MELLPKEWQRQKDPGQTSRRQRQLGLRISRVYSSEAKEAITPSRETEAGRMRPGTRSQGIGRGSVAVQGVGGEGARLEGTLSSVCQWSP